MNKLTFLKPLIFCALFTGAQQVVALESPTMFVEKVFADLVAQLDELQRSPSVNEVETLFTRTLGPHIDYPGLARWTLREHWKNSSEDQRTAFLSALEKHVMKTYASALTFDKSIRLNLDDDIKPGKRLIQVTGQLEGVGSGSTNVLFRLVGTDGSWQIFDVGIHGISIAKTLRADIAAIAGTGGIDAATSALKSGSLQLLSQR